MDVTSRRIEPEAQYRLVEAYRTAKRPGLVPFGKTWIQERVNAGELPVRKLGRAALVRGADLLRLLGEV